MSSPDPGGSAPRLVYDATSKQRAEDEPVAAPVRSSRGRAFRLLFAALLVAASIAAVEQWRRAAALERRVEELSSALASAQNELAARRAQLDTIRGSLADVRERITAIEDLAASNPTAPAATQSPPPAPH